MRLGRLRFVRAPHLQILSLQTRAAARGGLEARRGVSLREAARRRRGDVLARRGAAQRPGWTEQADGSTEQGRRQCERRLANCGDGVGRARLEQADCLRCLFHAPLMTRARPALYMHTNVMSLHVRNCFCVSMRPPQQPQRISGPQKARISRPPNIFKAGLETVVETPKASKTKPIKLIHAIET